MPWWRAGNFWLNISRSSFERARAIGGDRQDGLSRLTDHYEKRSHERQQMFETEAKTTPRERKDMLWMFLAFGIPWL
jgi:hypothetical protein